VWENWSTLEAFYMKTLGNFNGPGVTMNPMDITIPRNFVDTHSVRLGGQYNAIKDWLTVRVGGWWESGAMPDAYTNLDLPSWDRWGLGLGLSTNIYGFEIAFSYNHIFQESREVTDGKITQQVMYVKTDTDGTPVSDVRPGYVVNNGSYSSSIDVFSFGLSYKFGGKAKKVEEELPPIMPDTLPLPNPAPAEEGQEAPTGQSAVNPTVETTPRA
jgi:long-subunit fatty acid transport protein